MQTDEAPGGYIRGGAGVVDTRWLFRVLVGSAVVVLAVLVAVLTIQAADKNSRIDNLRHRGVPVDVTVTDCLGILSGTGITVTSFQCNGSFELAGRSYNAVIAGSNANHAAGDVVKAIADPKHPTSVSTASSLANDHSSWQRFIGAAVLFLLLVLLIVGALWRSKRHSAQRARARDALDRNETSSSTVGTLASAPSSSAFSAPVALLVALVVVIAGALWWSRRNSAQRPHDAEALG